MRKPGTLFIVAVLVAGAASPALARLQYLKVFDEVYLKEHENQDFAKEARNPKMRCLLCHQGKNRKHHNPYGIHIVEAIGPKKNVRDVPKIKEALAKVGAMHSDPDDETSPTYDEMLQAGTFPGGTLEEASKEPEAK